MFTPQLFRQHKPCNFLQNQNSRYWETEAKMNGRILEWAKYYHRQESWKKVSRRPNKISSCAAVHGVAKSRTRLSDFTFTFHFHALEKAMAAHSIVLAWRIPGTGEPGGLQSMGSHRVRHDWSDLAAAANTEDIRDNSLIHRSERSPGGRHDNPLQDSCLENPTDKGASQATVHRVAKSQTCLKWVSTYK